VAYTGGHCSLHCTSPAFRNLGSLRFADFETLPAHYNLAGEPTRFSSRMTMVWLLPVVFSFILLAIALGTAIIPRAMQTGDLIASVLISGAGLMAAQGYVL